MQTPFELYVAALAGRRPMWLEEAARVHLARGAQPAHRADRHRADRHRAGRGGDLYRQGAHRDHHSSGHHGAPRGR